MIKGESEAKLETETIIQKHNDIVASLLQELHTHQQQYQALVDANYEQELQFRKHKNDQQSILLQKQGDYGTLIKTRSIALEELEHSLVQDKEEYDALEAHFKEVDRLLAIEVHEKYLLLQFQKLQEHGERALYNAVVIIQKHIRGRQTRLKLKALKNKDKGKGKGKGIVKGKGTALVAVKSKGKLK